MREQLSKLSVAVALATVPVTLFAFSQLTGPPVKRTGAAIDGGVNCTACHRSFAANADPRGSLTITTTNYVPGVRQKIRVTVSHPESKKWGFQLTARLASDQTKNAGVLNPTADAQVICEDLANPANIRGVVGPCTGAALAFANHKPEATLRGANGTMTFEVDWDPPASNAGDVVFYAAGNAADNSSSNLGDRIYTTSKVISTCSSTTAPTISAVTDAAGAGRNWSAANGLISIWGSGFAPAKSLRVTDKGDMSANGRFPTALGCVAVEVAGQRVPVLAVTDTQINAQVPTNLANGNYAVRVVYNPDGASPLASDISTVAMLNAAPAVFTFNGKSAAAVVSGTQTRVSTDTTIPGARAVKPGEVVELYATGLGATQPFYQAGEIPSAAVNLTTPVTVTMGGTTIAASDVLYSGLAPGFISGLYQINFRVPQTASDGDQPLSIQAAGINSQTGVILPVKR